MSITHSPYVRCYWTGSMFLINGKVMAINCTNISTKMIEIEAPSGVEGSKMVKLELKAMHEGRRKLIKVLCDPELDILNERNKHFLKFKFHTIAKSDVDFIKQYVEYHSSH